MAHPLERRINALERRVGQAHRRILIHHTFVTPYNLSAPVAHAEFEGRSLHRADGESPEDFIDRVTATYIATRPDRRVLRVILSPDDSPEV